LGELPLADAVSASTNSFVADALPLHGKTALNNVVTIPLSILVGDTNANGTVNAVDMEQTKSRLGQTVADNHELGR
jgi:hypothetical protein